MSIPYLLLALVTILFSFASTRAMRKAFSHFRSREQKAGKELIYRHFPKQKKPLGGGVAIFVALTAGMIVATLPFFHITLAHLGAAWIWLLCGIAFAAIGWVDDWRKVNAARGLREITKLALQIITGLVFTLLILQIRPTIGGHLPTAVFLPFVGDVALGFFFIPFGIFFIVGFTNAVNLTDGMDGLAGTSLALTLAGYLLLAVTLQQNILVPLIALCSLAGFLFYNRPTAKIIMGDTGALGLGALLAALALLTRTEWLLLLFGAPFVINTLSVLIQVTVIKFFRGPVRLLRHQTTEVFRPFLCTPLHHHFQWLTWGPWPILALYSSLALVCGIAAILALPAMDGSTGYAWFWVLGLAFQASFLVFAALQKVFRANYFLGLEFAEGSSERVLALYKGLPVEALGVRWYNLEEVTSIAEGMVNAIAAESILWRNISEIEARATLGKIYAEYKMFDKAAEEWEEIPLRNLLIRESLVVQLGKIYFGRDELLRAIKLWEQLPASRLTRMPGLPETIQSAKVRVGHLAGRLYHQARERANALRGAIERGEKSPTPGEIQTMIAEIEAALRYTQDLRDLLAYEQRKGESDQAEADPGGAIYRRMDTMLTNRREDLHQALDWAQSRLAPAETEPHTPLEELAHALRMTPAEMSSALEVNVPLPVRDFSRIERPSRNTLYRISLDKRDNHHLPERVVAKCYADSQVTFFSACYRRERGVLQILHDANAPVPTPLGGHLGSRMAVLFLHDLGAQSLSVSLQEIPAEDRAGKIALLRRGVETLVTLHTRAVPVLPRLEREIGKIVKEVLTPEYYLNTTAIAINRILALDHRQLTLHERGRLEAQLRPLISVLQDEPKTFIHFEYTPGNLQLLDGHIYAVDFEQSTMGPTAFDLASLLYCPEADLSDTEVQGLLEYYAELLPAEAPVALTIRPEALYVAGAMKMLFYAGSAANFFRKFEECGRIAAMDWHLQAAERLLLRAGASTDFAMLLREWNPMGTKAR